MYVFLADFADSVPEIISAGSNFIQTAAGSGRAERAQK